jgi:hypothetical protein
MSNVNKSLSLGSGDAGNCDSLLACRGHPTANCTSLCVQHILPASIGFWRAIEKKPICSTAVKALARRATSCSDPFSRRTSNRTAASSSGAALTTPDVQAHHRDHNIVHKYRQVVYIWEAEAGVFSVEPHVYLAHCELGLLIEAAWHTRCPRATYLSRKVRGNSSTMRLTSAAAPSLSARWTSMRQEFPLVRAAAADLNDILVQIHRQRLKLCRLEVEQIRDLLQCQSR